MKCKMTSHKRKILNEPGQVDNPSGCKNDERNSTTHIIKSRYYKDTQKMNDYLNTFKLKFYDINENNELYYIKNEIIEFTNKLII